MRKGQGEPGFPFRNPSLSAAIGDSGKTDSPGPAKPGLRATRVLFIHLGGGSAAMYV